MVSFPKQLHHPSVVLRLLGQLFRLGHLHHLPQQVEGQVQGYRWVFGPPPPLHRLVPAVGEATYERSDVTNFPLQEAPRQLELLRSVEDGWGSAGIVQGGERVRVPVSQPDEILLSEALQNGARLLLLLLLLLPLLLFGVLALESGDAQGTAWALNSPTFVAR